MINSLSIRRAYHGNPLPSSDRAFHGKPLQIQNTFLIYICFPLELTHTITHWIVQINVLILY